MSSLIKSEPNMLNLVNNNVYKNERGLLISSRKKVNSFLADYNRSDIPALPENISSNVDGVISETNSLVSQNSVLQEKARKKTELQKTLGVVQQSINQSTGFINRLHSARNQLESLRKSENEEIRSQAIELFGTATKYLSSLINLRKDLQVSKGSLETTLSNV